MTPKVEREEKGSKRRVVVDKGMRGTIGGGGTEYTFKNFIGDIIVRKGKQVRPSAGSGIRRWELTPRAFSD